MCIRDSRRPLRSTAWSKSCRNWSKRTPTAPNRSGGGPGRGTREDRGGVGVELASRDRPPCIGHQLAQEREVVQAEEADGGQLLGAGEVAEVVAVVVAAGGAGAAGGDRVAVALPAG